jgi:hypothetical protein
MCDDRFEISRSEFFSVYRCGSRYLNEFLQISTLLFKKFLWDMKLRKRLPDIVTLKEYFSMEIVTLSNISAEFKKIFENCGINREHFREIWLP